MVCRRDTDNTVGEMAAVTKVISSRVIETVMECGMDLHLTIKITEVTISLIRKTDMASMIGGTDTVIRAILLTINAADKDSSSSMKS
jgi:hypothetical protein